MIKKPYLACLLASVASTTFLLQACDNSPVDNHLPPANNSSSVAAVLVGSPSEVVSGPPGAYFISADGRDFHLRCPGGNCTKHSVMSLISGTPAYVEGASVTSGIWHLSGEPGKPSLSPSIHWLEKDGSTHWHGWLRNGYFER